MDPELRQYLAAVKGMSLSDTNDSPRQGRKRKKLTTEMILRKSFGDTLREYARNCSLAGVQQMCDPDIGLWKRLVRILVFLAAIAMCCYCVLHIWSNTLTNPLIVSMESSTYPISEIDFPAVALCNVNRISKKALQQMAKEEYHDLAKRKEPIEKVEAMLLQWGRLLDYSYNDSLRKNPIYVNLVEKYMHDTHRVTDIMKRLSPSCEDQLLRCLWAGEIVDCRKTFTMRRTVLGYCCTFNFNMAYDSNEKMIAINPTKRQTKAGYLFGLSVILDPMLDDYAYSVSHTLGYEVFIFPALHFADPKSGRVIHRKAEPNMGVFYELTATKQVATPEVRRYSLNTRQCLFHDEKQNMFRKMYSYNTCIVYCRVITIQSLCKCTPYFMSAKTVFAGPICTLDDLRCLEKYKDKLSNMYPMHVSDTRGLEVEMQNSLHCPNCYPDCELTSYSVKSFEIKSRNSYDRAKHFPNNLVKSINMTNKVALTIYYPNQDAILDRLDVVSYWYEILSNVGGFSGIVIGFSIISVVELIFFFTIRFSHHLYVNYLEYK